MQNLHKQIKITRVMNAVAVGTTTQTATAVDMQGFDGVLFLCAHGTITDGAPPIKAREGAAANMSDAADLAGSSVAVANSDDNKLAVLDVFKPLKRYVDMQVVRGGAVGSVIDGVIAVQYCAEKRPTTQDTTTVAANKLLISPSEGTA